MKLSKLGLGTVQLGMEYGINNVSGKPSFAESKAIIEKAWESGINVFDTALGYGDSEEILGKALKEFDKEKVVFISKVPPTHWSKEPEEIIERVNNTLRQTLRNLDIKYLPIYLFHRFSDIEKKAHLILKELKKLQAQGLIEKLGVSIYTPEEAEKTLTIEEMEVVQIPFNLINKRLLTNGFLKKAKQKGITIIARSVFLQGLFFKKEVPSSLSDFRPYQQKILKICQEENLRIEELALRYALSIKEIDTVLVGVEKLKQLAQNLKIWQKGKLPQRIILKINDLGSAPEKIINPSLWSYT